MVIHPTHTHILNITKIFSKKTNEIKVLDSGCGTGKLMKMFLESNFDIYGYDISDLHKPDLYSKIEKVSKVLVEENRIKIISINQTLPFDGDFFDFIVSNQVVEHVKNIDLYFKENIRVLKPGGKFILCFPTKEIIIEPHIKLPFLHFLSKKMQFLYLYFYYKLDYEKSSERLSYLNDRCFYRKLDYFRSLDTNLKCDLSFTPNLFSVKFPFIKKYFSLIIRHIPIFLIARLTSITVIYTKNEN
jgi:SAM-dependent methyltransferase